MPRLRAEFCRTENLTVKYDVSVDKNGTFTTTLPPDIVSKLKQVGIELRMNRLHNEGFFSAPSLEGLKHKVRDIIEKYSEKELIEEKIILKYSLDTTCTYCKTKAGEIVPNGSWQLDADGEYSWINGTHNDTLSRPWGFSCYVEPRKIKVWKFPDGETKTEKDKEKIEKERVNDGEGKEISEKMEGRESRKSKGSC